MTTAIRKSGVRNQHHKEQVADKISLTTKYGMYQAVQKGFVVSRPPYGYNVSAKRTLEVDQEAAEVVKIIYNWSEKGLGVKKIAQMLKNSDTFTPSEYRSRKRVHIWKRIGLPLPSEYQTNTKKPNCNWNPATVLRMLRNEVYTGVLIYGKHSISGYIIEIEDNHTPIISKEQFYKVQYILSLKFYKNRGRI